MKYSTILSMPDSKEKFLKLERKLLQLQHHGNEFFEAKKEWHRLYNIYRKGGEVMQVSIHCNKFLSSLESSVNTDLKELQIATIIYNE